MISEHNEARLNALFNTQASYRPNADIATQLAHKQMIMLVGATCQGKSTIMQKIVELDSRFGICGTFTSRAPRDSDGAGLYTYYENSDAGLAPLLARIEQQEVVQYAINPFSKLLYGSELQDYPYEYNIGDFFASAVENFRQLGFGSTITVSIITEPGVWLKRFEERFPLGDPQRKARRDEALQSFMWSIEQTHDHNWVENTDGNPTAAAQQIIDITEQNPGNSPNARAFCEESLALARKILV